MARGVNKVIIIGNLGQDPESKNAASGVAICNITVAVNESWKDKATGEQVEKTEWVRVVFFNRLAEIAGEYLTKGSQVYIEGKLQTRKYEQDGVTKYSTEVIAHELQMLGSKPSSTAQPARAQSNPAAPPQPAAPSQPAFGEDDIPF